MHGNFAEHVPLSLLLILLMEQLGLAAVYLHAFGITLLIARLSHWLALKQSSGPTLPRTLGVGLNITVLVGGAVVLIGLAIAHA